MYNNSKTFIIDTKWKVAHGKPTNDDLRQMSVHMQHWESQQALLLYPCSNEEMVDVEDTYHQFPSQRCKLGFINILDEQGIKNSDSIVQEILQKLICSGISVNYPK